MTALTSVVCGMWSLVREATGGAVALGPAARAGGGGGDRITDGAAMGACFCAVGVAAIAAAGSSSDLVARVARQSRTRPFSKGEGPSRKRAEAVARVSVCPLCVCALQAYTLESGKVHRNFLSLKWRREGSAATLRPGARAARSYELGEALGDDLANGTDCTSDRTHQTREGTISSSHLVHQ